MTPGDVTERNDFEVMRKKMKRGKKNGTGHSGAGEALFHIN